MPEVGKCFVSALVINDYFGGKIIKAKSSSAISHYWNRIDDIDIDLTKGQFPENEIFADIQTYSRKQTDHNECYFILKENVEEVLNRV